MLCFAQAALAQAADAGADGAEHNEGDAETRCRAERLARPGGLLFSACRPAAGESTSPQSTILTIFRVAKRRRQHPALYNSLPDRDREVPVLGCTP